MSQKFQFRVLLSLGIAGSTLAGCASIEDFNYKTVNRARASVAWKEARACLPEEAINSDFACGFKDGYYAVAMGGSSCPPITPPPRYWKAKYQSTAGQAAVNQWYQGYQSGVIAAEQDGRNIWTSVPTQDGPGVACPPPCGEECMGNYSCEVSESTPMLMAE